MNEPIYLYPDKPTFLTAKFQDEFGAECELKYDIAPMFREIIQGFESLPERPLHLIQEEAERTGQDATELQERYRLHRLAFIEKATHNAMRLFQDITRQAVGGTMTLVANAIWAKTLHDLNEGEFKQRPLYIPDGKLVDAIEKAHRKVRLQFNEQLGIKRGGRLELVFFWKDMEEAWRSLNVPLSSLSGTTQETFANACEITVEALKARIRRNLKTDWQGFKEMLQPRLE